MISKPLKSIKPARKVFHAIGTAMSAMICPATSSITTNCGSFLADARLTRVAAGIPIRMTNIATATASVVRSDGDNARATIAQIRTVAADAQLPGPGRRCPIPKNVAASVAHSGARGRKAPSSSLGPPFLIEFGTPALRPDTALSSGAAALRSSDKSAHLGSGFTNLPLPECGLGSLPRCRLLGRKLRIGRWPICPGR